MTSDIRFYRLMFLKRLPIMAAIFVLCAGIGVGAALTLPPRYESEARLLVQSAQIETDERRNSRDNVAAERLQVIEQRLMTRQNLIDIANKFRVFDGEPRMSPDVVVERMEELTSIRTSSGRNRATLMTITFNAASPAVAANVVNEMVTLILAEDRDIRVSGAQGALDFYTQEVRRLSDVLTQKSAAIVEYKETNKDALPETLQYRINQENLVRERVLQAVREIATLEEQKKQLDALGAQGVANNSAQLSPEQQALRAARAELRTALTVYSETNPRVKLLRAQIEQLEASAAETAGVEVASSNDPAQALFELRRGEIESRIADAKQLVEKGEEELARLTASIERTPEVEIRLAALQRDYDVTQQQLNQRIASLNEAQTEERIEDQSKGERVTVVEQAVAPTEPASPNRVLIAGGSVFAGTGLALGFFLLTEFLNRAIRRPTDLVKALGIQPLATIPYLEDERVARRRKTALIVLTAALILAIPIGLWAIHTFYLPLDLVFEKVFDKLGF